MILNLIMWYSIAVHLTLALLTTNEEIPSTVSPHTIQPIICTLDCGCTNGTVDWYVNCEGKSIVQLPKGIEFPPEVNDVTFHDNSIRNVSNGMFAIGPNVKQLDLSKNKISTIEDSSFSSFSAMTTLHLSYNNLTSLEKGSLRGLANLETLELGHNSLRELPERVFEHNPVLRVLHLQHNNLQDLSDTSLAFLQQLERLDLQANGLMQLSSGLFLYTPKLQWMTLADNKFEDVPRLALHRAPMLSSLDLSGNLITAIEADTFSLLVNVTTLHLDNLHHLVRIEKHAFAKLTRLRSISCSYNQQLTYIHPEIFNLTRTLHNRQSEDPVHIMLRNNGLRHIQEPREIEAWVNAANFDFSDNPWQCDCNLQWMARIKTNHVITLRCESPWLLHGRSIVTLSEEDLVCEQHLIFSTVVMILATFVAFTMLATFLVFTACTRTPLGDYVKARIQFNYAQVSPKKDCIDLEWDPTAEF